MPFPKIEAHVDFSAQERELLQFWDRTRIFDQLREMRRGGPRWSFLDGPITANNPMGVHHAWGRTLKDVFQRYHAMRGFDQRWQNGFDCQGLWVEVEVERELGLRSKQDIENLVPGDRFASIDEFVRLCKERVDRFAKRQTEQSIRLGYWMNWDRAEDWAKPPDHRRSYFTHSETNNYAIWGFLKKCHERGLIYRAYDAMPWCPRCAVGISQMEMHEGYKRVAHRAVFVKFPLRGRPGEHLLVWTTTPWTLSSNVAAAVNPELTYVQVRHHDETYWLARGALTAARLEEDFKKGDWVPGVPKLKPIAQLFKEKGGYEIVRELRGAELVGWTYDGPFDDLPAQDAPYGYPEPIAKVVEHQAWAPAVSGRVVHRIIPWDAVGELEGTGIVHIAPGCGKEDFGLGRQHGLPPIAPLDEEGTFLNGFGPLSGKTAYEDATVDLILDLLRAKGRLLAVEKYPHNYPHCWRCKTELLFRLVDEWFISMSWREEIMRVCHEITWIPEFGLQRELDWLRNMGDWMISKKRYWGLALPIWVDEETGDFEVIGSREELQARAVEGFDRFQGHTPHRPWIDLVKIRHPRTGRLMTRIPDVGNPWLDAGIVPFSTMGYFTNRAEWEKWFPADFITECFPGQFRNWFYALLAMSTMLAGRAPFKVLLGHALVRDEHGEEMHKSKGNAIAFEAAVDEGWTVTYPDGRSERKPPMSADVMRWLYCRQNPAHNLNFGSGPAEELRNKVILKLWHTLSFFCNYARLDGFDPHAPQVPLQERPDIDRWILSDLQLLIQTARREFERYSVHTFCQAAEQFVDDKLSNWYVRRNRRRFWKSEQGIDKLAAYQTLYTVLTTLSRLLAPIVPFLAETMYQHLVVAVAQPEASPPPSVHLWSFPEPDAQLIDEPLSADMEALLRLVSLTKALRNQVKIKVRQPLAALKIQPGLEADRRAVVRFASQLEEECNIKSVSLHEHSVQPLVTFELKGNPKTLGPKFGPRLPVVQAAIAAAANEELARRLLAGQSIRVHLQGEAIELGPEDVTVITRGPEGWAVLIDRGSALALDVRVTEELKKEGLARDVVRNIQELRKEANLDLDDRIKLWVHSSAAELQSAIEAFRDYIMAETLCSDWAAGHLGEQAAKKTVKIDGHDLRIELRKAS
jgi:isoleucyl-tRNA synthetase